MARIDLDRLYALFNSEASEQDGNFYFVKQYDEKLYSRLCKIERNAVVNLEHSGSELRGIFSEDGVSGFGRRKSRL